MINTPLTPETTTQVTKEVARLLPVCIAPITRQELLRKLGLRTAEHFRKSYLVPALSTGLIEMTIPDKPNSRLQQYRLTAKGRAWLEANQARG